MFLAAHRVRSMIVGRNDKILVVSTHDMGRDHNKLSGIASGGRVGDPAGLQSPGQTAVADGTAPPATAVCPANG